MISVTPKNYPTIMETIKPSANPIKSLCTLNTKRREYENMPKRITFLIDDDTYKRLRSKQASEIKKTASTISFSKIINDALKKSL